MEASEGSLVAGFHMLGIGVVVAQQTLTLSVQVRFLYPLPNKIILGCQL